MTCTRCGSPLPSLGALADLADTVQELAQRVGAGWRAMRLAVPRDLAAAMLDLERDAPRLASALACHAGRCGGGDRAQGHLPGVGVAASGRGVGSQAAAEVAGAGGNGPRGPA